MILCYSATQKTKPYAEVLGTILEKPVYMLEADFSILKSLWLTLRKKPAPVHNMPATSDITDDDIYLCGPVWGGYPAAPLRYFLMNASLSGKKVHMLLTAGMSHNKYGDNAKKLIIEAGAVPGNVEVFSVDTKADTKMNQEIIEEHIRHLMLQDKV